MIQAKEIQSVLEVYTNPVEIEQARKNSTTRNGKLTLGMTLIMSKQLREVKEGVDILKDLIKTTGEDEDARAIIYHLAIGNAKLKKYDVALDYLNALLTEEPQNLQAVQLQKIVNNKMNIEGWVGAAILGGAAALVGGVVLAAFSLSKK